MIHLSLLAFGLLVGVTFLYRYYRPHSIFISAGSFQGSNVTGSELFNNIPSFVFAFSFLCIALVLYKPNKAKVPCFVLFWVLWSLFWEFIQLFDSLNLPYLWLFNNYANSGVFDAYDVVATFVGTVAAFLIYYFYYGRFEVTNEKVE